MSEARDLAESIREAFRAGRHGAPTSTEINGDAHDAWFYVDFAGTDEFPPSRFQVVVRDRTEDSP